MALDDPPQILVTHGDCMLQVADGAMAQVTNLLNRAVTLATEASNGTMNSTQITAANAEYLNILGEIDNIDSNTEYNGTALFGATPAIYTTDGTIGQTDSNSALANVDSGTLSLTAAGFTTSATAITELAKITTAIATIATDRGTVGANINTLSAVANVMYPKSGRRSRNIALLYGGTLTWSIKSQRWQDVAGLSGCTQQQVSSG